jgi:RND family efflux transporter MFP subunit
VLSFAVIGTVQQVYVQEGQAVRRGQLIARISPRSYQDALNIAKSKASQAEDAQRRLRPMYDNKTLPEVKMVEVDTGLEQARLAVSMAAKNLEDTVLRAPSNGVVARRSAEPGSSVAPGVPVVTLVQTRTVLANAPVPETRISKVKPGDNVRVHVSALDKWFDGRVRDIGLVADPLTRTYATRIAIPNQDSALRIGMVADIELEQAEGQPAVVVPPEAVRLDAQGNSYVFVLKGESQIEQRPVKIAGYVGEGCAIAEGVADGERVVTSGTSMLEQGMTVRVVERKTGAL